MGGLNPLDWTAGPFLSLYIVLAGGVLLLLQLRRTRLSGQVQDGVAAGLGVLHLAYLSGGAERAAETALVALLEARAAMSDRRRGVLHFDPSVPVATEFRPFRHVDGGEAGRDAFQMQFAPRWRRLHAELAGRGLVPGAAELSRFRWRGGALLGVPLLLGLSKVVVGLSRDRPVGILAILLVLTGVFGAVLLMRRPHRNRAGVAILAAARRDHARAARAPLSDEMALAFALTGAAVLAGRDYGWALAQSGSSSGGDSGSSGDGGGDGGGGCGGCSG